MRAGKRRAFLAGLVVIALFGAGVLLAVTAHRGLPGTTAATVKVAFDDVGSLRAGNDVRIGGVRVGQVSDIAYQNGRAVAELQLSEVDAVYRNAQARTASVGARSTLGAKFINLNPGSPEAGEIGPEEVIEADDTTGAEDITELLDTLDKPTRDALGSLLRETGGGVAGRQGDIGDAVEALPSMLPDLGTVSRALAADGGADLTRALRALDSLAGRFDGRQDQIARLTRQLGTTLEAVSVDGTRPLKDTLDRSPATLRQVRGALRSLDEPLADTRSAATRLRPGGEALAAALPDVRGLLREGPGPLDKVPGVAKKAIPAVRALTGVMTDARPLAPQVTSALDNAADPLAVLAPYSPEIAQVFTNMKRALSGHDGNRHWLRVLMVPSSEMAATGMLPGFSDPMVARNPYPEPGEAATDRKSGLTGTGGN